MESALLEAAELEILELGDACLVLDGDWRVAYLNANQERLWQRPRAEVVGRSVWDLWSHDPYSEAWRELRRAMSERVHVEVEYHDPPTDTWWALTAYPTRQGGLAVFTRDITTRKRIEEAEHAARGEAERALAVVDALIASSLVGFGFIDTDLRYVRVNEPLAAVNGSTVAAHVGRTVREVLADHADALEPLLRGVIETGEPLPNIELTTAPPGTPGQVRSFFGSYFPVRMSSGQIIGVGAAVLEVTSLKQAEAGLREREALFRTLADNIPQLAWMADPSGSIFWYNQRWFDFTGTNLDEMAGWGWEKVHHPSHVERVVEKIRHCFEAGEEWEDTFPLRGQDGEYRWFLSRAVPIRDAQGNVVRWFGTNTDVTEQRFLAESTRVLSSSLDYRTTLQKMAELTLPALGDWCVIELVQPDGAVEAIAEAGSSQVSAATPTQPDRVVSVPLLARGRSLGSLTVASHVSGRRYGRADIELLEEVGRRVSIALDNARLYEEAQRAVQMREEILAVVSHDLRNPLAAIQLATAMLLRKPGADLIARTHVETIHRSANRLDHRIGDLMDMASIQAGRLALERKPEDPAPLLREVLDLHVPAAKEKGFELIGDFDLNGSLVLCDRDRVMQVFENLIGNAMKFGRAGDTIRVAARLEGAVLRLGVLDTGPGVPADELAHLFEPYWSAERHARKGMGLGLYISKGIVEAHGGRLWVESEPGSGASFFFTLPVVAA